jgi:hypothetical protein
MLSRCIQFFKRQRSARVGRDVRLPDGGITTGDGRYCFEGGTHSTHIVDDVYDIVVQNWKGNGEVKLAAPLKPFSDMILRVARSRCERMVRLMLTATTTAVTDFKNAMVSNDISDARLTELYDIAVILQPSILDAPIWWNSLTNRLSARPKDSLTVTGIDPIDVRSPTAAYFSTLDLHQRVLLANRLFTFEANTVGIPEKFVINSSYQAYKKFTNLQTNKTAPHHQKLATLMKPNSF